MGYSNYKYFVLFLFYTVVLCAWFSLTGLYDFIRAWVRKKSCMLEMVFVPPLLSFIPQSRTLDLATADKFNVIFCYFVCTLFGLSTSSLLVFHVYLSLFNRTTIGMMHVCTHFKLYFCQPQQLMFTQSFLLQRICSGLGQLKVRRRGCTFWASRQT